MTIEFEGWFFHIDLERRLRCPACGHAKAILRQHPSGVCACDRCWKPYL